MFSTCLENFLPFLSNFKLSSAKSVSLDESKICHLGKGSKCGLFQEAKNHTRSLSDDNLLSPCDLELRYTWMKPANGQSNH